MQNAYELGVILIIFGLTQSVWGQTRQFRPNFWDLKNSMYSFSFIPIYLLAMI